MTCKECFQEISRYLDGELSAELKRVLHEHLGNCAHCKVVYDTTVKTVELYCDGKLFPMPDFIRTRLHDVLRRKYQERAS